MTVKEISELCGVSQQSIRNWCAKNNVTKERNARTKASYVIDETTKQAIIEHYSKINAIEEKQERKERTKENKERTKEDFFSVEKLLAEKDAQYIELLKAEQDRNRELTETIQKQADTIQQLSAQLTAAQQIQAGTVKALLTEQNKQEQPIQQAATEPEIKQGFFSRLFRKKNK